MSIKANVSKYFVLQLYKAAQKRVCVLLYAVSPAVHWEACSQVTSVFILALTHNLQQHHRPVSEDETL